MPVEHAAAAPSVPPCRPRGAPRAALAAVAAGALAFVGVPSAAADQPYASGRLYAEAQVGGANVEVSNLRFYPLLGGVTVGAYVAPGIGLELHAEGGIDADDDGGFELGLEGAAGAALRLESPPVGGTSGYVTLGYAVWTPSLEPESGGAGAEVDEDFTGPRASIGLVQRLRRVPALSVSAEYRAWYTDDGLRMTALLLGLRLSGP